MPAQSIKIFLVDGTSSGVRTAELSLSTIKALVVPRASLSAVATRDEVKKTGIYVLVGPDSENLSQRKVYVGEGDTIISRLTAHNGDKDKDFWDQAVVFVSKDENLTKAHVRYLEAKLIALANEAKRATVINGTAGSQGKLPEADSADMEQFITQARLLLGSLGYDIFEPVQTRSSAPLGEALTESDDAPLFKFSGEYFDAVCIVDVKAGQFVVKMDSKARRLEAPTLTPTYKNLRAQLIQNGVLAELDANSYGFSQDFAFGSPTAAAQAVSGTTTNGRTAWKAVSDERTFADWEDAQLGGAEGPPLVDEND